MREPAARKPDAIRPATPGICAAVTAPGIAELGSALEALADLALAPAPRVSSAAVRRLGLRLDREWDRLTDIMAHETGYGRADCHALLGAARRFADNLPALPALHRWLTEAEEHRYAALAPAAQTSGPAGVPASATIELRPWGTCLVCSPANAPAPLALALPLALVAAGNRVVLAQSGGARRTGLELGRLVAEEIGGVVLWTGRVRDAVSGLVAAGAVDLVYFLGSSAYYAELAGRCAAAGVELLYEGEGNGLAVVDRLAPRDLAPVIDALITAKLAFGGRMCSAPNAVVVPRGTAGQFADTWAERAERTAPGRGPSLVRGATLSDALAREVAGPLALLVEYDDWDELAGTLARARHRLQLSLFSRDPERIERMRRVTGFARYCVNMCPIDQDPLRPWGNYGLSGRSDVVDFYRKGLRRVLVERGTLLG